MSVGRFFGSLFGGAVGGAASPATAIVDSASKIIGLFKLDPTVKAQLQAALVSENVDLEKAQLAADLAQAQGQIDIDKIEAQSPNWYIAGARPAVMWVCVLALAYAYVFQPFAQFVLAVFKVNLQANLPSLDTGTLISGLLIPLLGLSTLRTIEKVTNTEGNR